MNPDSLSSVLLIEDNPGDARLIEEMLQKASNRASAAAVTGTGETAPADGPGGPTLLQADRLSAGLQQLADSAVDIVLLDLGLPDSSGLESLTAVLEHRAEVPVVVLTGLADERVGVEAVQRGAQSYLLKDEITSELLVRSMRHALERHQRETQLTALTTVSQDLMAATTAEEIAAATVDAAADVLGLPVACVCLYDADRGALEPAAVTDAGKDLLLADGRTGGGEITGELAAPYAAIVRQTFATRRATVETDGANQTERTDRTGGTDQTDWTDQTDGADRTRSTDEADRTGSTDDEPGLESLVVLPLATHGVFLAGAPTSTVPTTTVDYARILATSTQSALERLDRERQLRERETALEAKTEALEGLERINTVIRDIAQAVVHATTRSDIEQSVCERLAGIDFVRFVWLGTHDELTGTVTPRARAGEEAGYLDGLTITADDSPAGRDPVGTAVRTRTVQVVDDVVRNLSPGARREDALKRDYRAIASIPLVHADTLHGVVTVYADRPGIFTDQTRAVLAELGEMIAYAVTAVERKKALISDRVVELEFDLQGTDPTFLDLSAQCDCSVTFETVVPREDERLRVFFSTRGASAEDVRAYAERVQSVEDLTLVAERDDACVFECGLREPNLVSFCAEHGVTLQTLTADGGEGRAIVELSNDADVRSFAAKFQTRYPGASLVASRERERSVQTRQGFRATLDGQLTDRQSEVLRTAFFSGYFDSPRENTGREVAERLGIAQPTFNHHLRAAQRKLLGLLYTE